MKILITTLMLLLSSYSHATVGPNGPNGNEFLKGCKMYLRVLDNIEIEDLGIEDAIIMTKCITLIEGVVITHGFFRSYYGDKIRFLCQPEKATWGQLVRIVVKYLEANPEKLHLIPIELVHLSLIKAFPCKT